ADVAGDVFVAGTVMRRLNGATGATRWESPPPGRGFSTLSTLLDAAGNPYAVGASFDEKQSQDIVVQAYSASSGAPLWPNAVRETGRCSFFDDPVAMAIDPSGNIAVTAMTT